MLMPYAGAVCTKSVDTFTYNDLDTLFDHGNKFRGAITTTDNGRTYSVTWNSSTNAISVKRNLTYIDGWTRVSEILARWSTFDFTTNAEKLESRLAIQIRNKGIAAPIKKNIFDLRIQLESLETRIDPDFFKGDAIYDVIDTECEKLSICMEIEKKRILGEAERMHELVTNGLPCSHLWSKKEGFERACKVLQDQANKLRFFLDVGRFVVSRYSDSLKQINSSKNTFMCAVIYTRLKAVLEHIAQTIRSYFNESNPNIRDHLYNALAILEESEEAILLQVSKSYFSHFIANDTILPPLYQDLRSGKSQRAQEKIKFSYQASVLSFVRTFTDIRKSLEDVKQAINQMNTLDLVGDNKQGQETIVLLADRVI